ncbi:hypothetical protein PACID_10310 [Acidipropionibacterium acidipropionici ATCC 4875]|uniref:Uncharacterized protein n=1 Tax=Acidipropionibacterium acidipropionici (strain ATCC 4875 / DSM 20272 / JCM 6432 / NBRC 12425 / NCIMB 8070 / 4) TaxID=1171373 RepID=K7SHZ5_ACIA4|nr:hypothetical protein PACID_10310 [Acidipropionibacterium acidipropionici ATCC 4875]
MCTMNRRSSGVARRVVAMVPQPRALSAVLVACNGRSH